MFRNSIGLCLICVWFEIGRNYEEYRNKKLPTLYMQNGEPMVSVDNTKFPTEVKIYQAKFTYQLINLYKQYGNKRIRKD